LFALHNAFVSRCFCVVFGNESQTTFSGKPNSPHCWQQLPRPKSHLKASFVDLLGAHFNVGLKPEVFVGHCSGRQSGGTASNLSTSSCITWNLSAAMASRPRLSKPSIKAFKTAITPRGELGALLETASFCRELAPHWHPGVCSSSFGAAGGAWDVVH